MKETIKQLFLLGLSVWFLPSCSEDRSDPNATTQEAGKTVTISLSAEVSVDDPSLRAIDYKLGKNAKGDLVPMPQFTDGQEVDVHTILKNRNRVVAQTLKWRYEAKTRKLVLDRSNGHNISISDFNNDGQEWYVSGLIGGTLIPGTTKVAFEGERVLKGVDGAEGDIVGSLNVPYFFAWTKLTIDTNSQKDSEGSYQYAMVPSDAGLRFTPLGALIAYKLGNAQTSGDHSFTPKGFTVYSGMFGDHGVFDLEEEDPHLGHPFAWYPTDLGMSYTFSDGHAPGILAHKSTASKTYYAWAMPNPDGYAPNATRVVLRGESSRPTSSTYRDYTNLYMTDYTPRGTNLSHGKVYRLTANATENLGLPLQYVANHNLAGGSGLTSVPQGQHAQLAGVQGPLRFADSHDDDQSGYYNGYKILGLYDAMHNSETRSLQTAIDQTFGPEKYIVPGLDQWTGVFSPEGLHWNSTSSHLEYEPFTFGPASDLYRRACISEYSRGFRTNDNTSAVVYGIRFKATYKYDYLKVYRSPAVPSGSPLSYYNLETKRREDPPLLWIPDNSLKCAYRFTRVGEYGNMRLVVDAVYLGEEAVPTSLSTISDESWWMKKKEQGLLISKTFSLPGFIHLEAGLRDRPVLEYFRTQAHYASAWLSTQKSFRVQTLSSVDAQNDMGVEIWDAMPVRLFHRRLE